MTFAPLKDLRVLLIASLALPAVGCLASGSHGPIMPANPPGPTTVLTPMPGYVLGGKIRGVSAQRVNAVALCDESSASAEPDAEQVFQFGYLSSCDYQLVLQVGSRQIRVEKAIGVNPGRSVFLDITVQLDPLRVLIDGMAIEAEELPTASGSASAR